MVPAELKLRPQWVVWKLEERDGKPTKPPYQTTGELASSTDARTWTTVKEAYDCWQSGSAEGVGFVVSSDDPYCGIDLDHCRNKDTGEIDEWAWDIVRRFDSYTEVTPSQTGIRIWIKASYGGDNHKKFIKSGAQPSAAIEIYDRERYFTTTGEKLPPVPDDIRDGQEQLDALAQELWPPATNSANKIVFTPNPTPDGLSAAEIIQAASQARNGAEFDRLMRGDPSAYQSPSEADQALMSRIVPFYTEDRGTALEVIRQSGLWDKKWERKDYVERAFKKAFEGDSGERYTRPNLGARNPETLKVAASPNGEIDPDEHEDRETPLPGFPIDCLPKQLAALSTHMAELWNTDPALYAVPGLAVLAAAIGNTVTVNLPGGQKSSANPWLAIIARTGSGKSPAADIVFRPLERLQHRYDLEYDEEKAEWRRLPKEQQRTTPFPFHKQVMIGDASWESIVQSLYNNPRGAVWWRDELIGTFKQLVAYNQSGGAYSADDLLAVWSQSPIRRQRVKDREVTIVHKPFLPMYGGLQPSRIPELGNNNSGRLSRLLCYKIKDDQIPYMLDDKAVDEQILANWETLVEDILSGRNNRDLQLNLSDEGKEEWMIHAKSRYERLRASNEEEGEFISKIDQHSGRFASILYMCEHIAGSRPPVESAIVQKSWQLTEMFLDHQLASFRPTVSDFIVDPRERAIEEAVVRLDEWLAKQGGKARRRDAQRKRIGGARTPQDMQKLVERWREAGMGRIETVQEASGGKPSIWLFQNGSKGPGDIGDIGDT